MWLLQDTVAAEVDRLCSFEQPDGLPVIVAPKADHPSARDITVQVVRAAAQ